MQMLLYLSGSLDQQRAQPVKLATPAPAQEQVGRQVEQVSRQVEQVSRQVEQVGRQVEQVGRQVEQVGRQVEQVSTLPIGKGVQDTEDADANREPTLPTLNLLTYLLNLLRSSTYYLLNLLNQLYAW
jgi:hypothetical protein